MNGETHGHILRGNGLAKIPIPWRGYHITNPCKLLETSPQLAKTISKQKLLLMMISEIRRENQLGCIKTLWNKWDNLPSPQLVITYLHLNWLEGTFFPSTVSPTIPPSFHHWHPEKRVANRCIIHRATLVPGEGWKGDSPQNATHFFRQKKRVWKKCPYKKFKFE